MTLMTYINQLNPISRTPGSTLTGYVQKGAAQHSTMVFRVLGKPGPGEDNPFGFRFRLLEPNGPSYWEKTEALEMKRGMAQWVLSKGLYYVLHTFQSREEPQTKYFAVTDKELLELTKEDVLRAVEQFGDVSE